MDDEVSSRLTLQTLLEAAGYFVDVATSVSEALMKLDERQYALVLSDLAMDSPASGQTVLSYARVKDYRPATALIRSYQKPRQHSRKPYQQVVVKQQDVTMLLGEVAELIARRASRRAARVLAAGG